VKCDILELQKNQRGSQKVLEKQIVLPQADGWIRSWHNRLEG